MDTSQTSKPLTYRLRKARLDAGVEQSDLAASVGLSLPKLQSLERNEQAQWPRQSVRTLVGIAKALGTTPTTLYPELEE